LAQPPYLAAYDSVTGEVVLLGVGLLFAAGFA
jgi:tight adherence protein B